MISKNKNNNYFSLEGKFLIASPNMLDSRFSEALIYMISDDTEGSMGIIVNKPALNLDLESFFNNFSKIKKPTNSEYPIHYGGPVEFNKGFILHTNDYETPEEKTFLKNNLVLSSNSRILNDLSTGNGPSKFIVVIGYAGWYSNQLAEELKQNSWLVANMNKKILFSKNYRLKWKNALKSIGIEEQHLQHFKFSNYSGSA
ncbi:MAG: hypothetical protein CFH34_01088 [Alphaproteobacteria bacterium MarineAlpha9_Bin4]|nr:hypothetical protein [Pelagibacterales bacterium]PPR26191.1 MAG: hypothetical protein CFH34_01088 [Alphaproteobacteria bacterium MarineAlpha9_Bin4]|tara:strand:+ start:3648 stop:4247 length:600 start_codon:yes stop_codon:yes gene_type:complete